ncbi:hypothetical protein JTE90_017507 [Oedothorax gibbosus]|uniref:Small ribosomal subunit protein mS35 mitochondrial conserved domain-containing protein n=1 Tax=Oedothorax gibbosus TaxID=931172 RepID=A0AAV6UCX2_9ARAC|nr:hypothetical protein JTE90_017507 [Oedothorax gibbosus]
MACIKICKHHRNLLFFNKYRIINYRKISTEYRDDEEFRVLELYPDNKRKSKPKSRFQDAQLMPPREKRMPINQDWPSVWPAAKTFRPSSVPLPLYQGYDQKRAPPGKYANTELIKIPNFLHLTPPAVKRHCEAIKSFCTKWPEALNTEEDCEKHFPIEVITSDYCNSAPTIRDERSRIVTLKIKLKALNLNYHARDKLLRLIGPRYNVGSDTMVLVADRCPLRKQNYDYLYYLLTAVHHESWVTEPWEHEKTEADMEKFFFENSRIQNKITKTILRIKSGSDGGKAIDENEVKKSEIVESFGTAVEALINEGETKTNMEKYKLSVEKSLNLSS